MLGDKIASVSQGLAGLEGKVNKKVWDFLKCCRQELLDAELSARELENRPLVTFDPSRGPREAA